MVAPLDGRLHIYASSKNLTCFESGSPVATNHLIFYGGLGTGLASMPVLSRLSAVLPPDWSLVQALTRSSYQGFLTTTSTETLEDMEDLEAYFRGLERETGRLVLMGASKGCNDVINFFNVHGAHTTADSAILMSLNCGLEALLQHFTVEELEKSLAIASSQIESGHGTYPFPPEVIEKHKILQVCKGIHANVWHTVMCSGGPAENLRSTANDEELIKTFEGIRSTGKNLHLLIAGNDEAIPDKVDKEELLRRFLNAARGGALIASGKVVEGAYHNMQQENAQAVIVESVLDFLKQSSKA